MICEHILLTTFLKEPNLIYLASLNGFKYFYLIWITLFTNNHLFAQSLVFSTSAMLQ